MGKSKENRSLFPEFVEIMGVPWRIQVKKDKEDPYFEKTGSDGYCSAPEKILCVIDYFDYEPVKDETDLYKTESMKDILRHEIVHAFLYESGLGNDSFVYRSPWARNEEMVDWFARQGTKIFRAWQEAGCNPAGISPENWMLLENARQTSP